VLLLDLDDFKTVNDSLGHAVGDELLVEVARRLETEVRPGDTASRLGGDEFAILLEDLSTPGEAMEVAHRLLASLRRTFTLRGRVVPVRASIGVALGDEYATDADAALRNADVAMYAAKAQGKGRCEKFTHSLYTRASERLVLEQELSIALAQREFRILYQPQFAIASGRLVGVEALVRWQHPRRGLLSPDTFIPLAEESGQVVAIDFWMLEAACQQASIWRAAGLPELEMSVNISGRAFEQRNFAHRIRAIVSESRLDPSSVELELTESAAVRQNADALEMLSALRAYGMRIAIDDFGTGYSVLARLQTFPIDRLKIDKKFIDAITASSGEAPIVTAMIAMAHGLGLDVVAEGVESAEQLKFLKLAGCDVLQGYLASRPVDAATIERMLRDRIGLSAQIASQRRGSLVRSA
jgi:diguanylate cyclase (GGDEF)-like protein